MFNIYLPKSTIIESDFSDNEISLITGINQWLLSFNKIFTELVSDPFRSLAIVQVWLRGPLSC